MSKQREPNDTNTTDNGDGHDQRPPRIPIVVLGASAGGLDALQRFFEAMSPESGVAFVVIQHLAADHESLTPSLLARHTAMSAIAVSQETRVEPNHIYVIAPNTALTVHDGRLEVDARTDDAGHWQPIDRCLASLAAARGAGAVAIILSGTGTDGTKGARRVKEHGGWVIVQEPDEAGFAGMAESAIEAGVVDNVLSVEDIPARVIEHLQGDDGAQPRPSRTERDVETHLSDLLALVKTRAQYNLAEYRPGTPMRRIARRMELCGIRRATDYLEHLKADPAELHHLVQDLFIGVTRFFRDPGAFDCLGDQVIAQRVRDKPAGSELRLWVAGCATGEEAYSLAIVIADCLAAADKQLDVRIFATDINEEALDHARRGLYSEAAASAVPPQHLAQYFSARAGGYQIGEELREWVTFAKHDLLSDPAFAHLDLITCRNVMIYLTTAVQRRLLGALHRALNPSGYLWLGQGETVGAALEARFEPVSRGWRIYRRIGAAAPPEPVRETDARAAATTDRGRGKRPAAHVTRARATLSELARRALLEVYAPASVVVDRQYQILHLQGDIQAYLKFPSGEATLHLIFMARRGLAPKLRRATDTAYRSGEPASVPATVQRGHTCEPVLISARPLRALPGAADDRLLVSFEAPRAAATPPGAASEAPPDDEPLVRQLETELQATQQELQHQIQRQEEASEEASATNEELQATNEELEASKEELQALNEELHTVNDGLHDKIHEVEAVRNDWRNLLISTDIAVVFLDRALNIRRYTPAVQRLFHLIDSDQGRPLIDLANRFSDGETLTDDARRVLETATPSQREVRSSDGRWYDRRIQPYRTSDDTVNGVVIAFVDMTPLKQATLQAEASRAYAQHLIETLHEAVLVLDGERRVLSANRAFYTLAGTTKEAARNTRLEALGDGQWDIPALRSLLERVVTQDTTFEDYEVTHDFPDVGERVMLLNARRLDNGAEGSAPNILLAMTDITHRTHKAQRTLDAKEQRYQMLFEAIPMLCVTATRSGEILTANRYAVQTLGVDASALVGHDFVGLHPEDTQQVRDRLMDAVSSAATVQRWESRLQHHSGELRWVRETAGLVVGADRDGILLIIGEDITDKRKRSELAYHAAHDPLTGLLNRREFERRLNQAIDTARREDKTHVMGFIDLDQFKIVNDTGGHLAGDEVLRQVAQLLRERVRGADTIARLGGDEFGLLLEDCDIPGAQHVADQLLRHLEQLRFTGRNHVFPVGMSIGLTAIDATSRNLAQVLGAADAACYQAKVQGRHRTYVYRSEDAALMQRHGAFEWVSRVARALEDGRLRLVYQPIPPAPPPRAHRGKPRRGVTATSCCCG